MPIFFVELFLRLAIIAAFFAVVVLMAKKPLLSITALLAGALACCHAKAAARDLPNINDLDISLILLAVLVIVFLKCVWWVEDMQDRRRAHERAMVDRAPMTPEQIEANEAELKRWLYEGQG